jgi:hypothetical protein
VQVCGQWKELRSCVFGCLCVSLHVQAHMLLGFAQPRPQCTTLGDQYMHLAHVTTLASVAQYFQFIVPMLAFALT